MQQADSILSRSVHTRHARAEIVALVIVAPSNGVLWPRCKHRYRSGARSVGRECSMPVMNKPHPSSTPSSHCVSEARTAREDQWLT